MKCIYSSLIVFVFAIVFIVGCSKDSNKPPAPYDYSNGVMKRDWVEFQLLQEKPVAEDLLVSSLTYANDFNDSTTHLTNYKFTSYLAVVHYFKATRDHQPVFFSVNSRGLQISLRIVVNGKLIREGTLPPPWFSRDICTPIFIPDSHINSNHWQKISQF